MDRGNFISRVRVRVRDYGWCLLERSSMILEPLEHLFRQYESDPFPALSVFQFFGNEWKSSEHAFEIYYHMLSLSVAITRTLDEGEFSPRLITPFISASAQQITQLSNSNEPTSHRGGQEQSRTVIPTKSIRHHGNRPLLQYSMSLQASEERLRSYKLLPPQHLKLFRGSEKLRTRPIWFSRFKENDNSKLQRYPLLCDFDVYKYGQEKHHNLGKATHSQSNNRRTMGQFCCARHGLNHEYLVRRCGTKVLAQTRNFDGSLKSSMLPVGNPSQTGGEFRGTMSKLWFSN
ncbi:predicted protein [Histoplasma capsulatum G186AR]|uniref:Uncharacterized protein n=1 Tax=Ajellomyces capsulatus (strain G186AR / H82 / ATCC MYA-2454 / RMSCC 2432) TaxID=447093 RepID=C0NMV3_AJECG|nr:uncharacterized protein HCBG_04080 [Histoplasma capsulatum G186AR]EEH07201.1 predicted protein [Histoplasma capsulatum G186AR]